MCQASTLTERCSTFSSPPPLRSRLLRYAHQVSGVILVINFIVFWAVPIFVQGQAFHLGLKRILVPIYRAMDTSPTIRSLASTYMYSKPQARGGHLCCCGLAGTSPARSRRGTVVCPDVLLP